jgi:hypothetical protein
MDNVGKVVSKKEVTETLVRNIASDQEEFKSSISILKHGQKTRLMEAMALYPLVDTEFDQSEPDLRVAMTVWKRINDSLVALGTEAAIEGIINGFAKNQRANISAREPKALKMLAGELLDYGESQIETAENAGELVELVDADDNEEADQA